MPSLRSAAYFVSGLAFLGMAMTKHRLMGYRTPKRVESANFDGCISYDLKVVDQWLELARDYCGPDFSIAGKDVLELGPGSDLGNGLYLQALGARSYAAVDAIDNVSLMPGEFYVHMAKALAQPPHGLTVDSAAVEDPEKICLYHSPKFDVAQAVGGRKFDVVFSNAAFEHFEDVDSVMRDVETILRTGGVLITVIDLMTHSRWIRDKDPNNIYRYPDWLYRLFHFKGIPNRWRPSEYRAAAEKHGLEDLVLKGTITDSSQSVDGLARRFRSDACDPTLLAVALCARKKA